MSFTANQSGGEYNHTLKAKELPYHEHAFYHSWGSTEKQSESHWNIPMQYNEKHEVGTWANNWSWNGSPITCGEEPHNNIQPYFVVYLWRKIA